MFFRLWQFATLLLCSVVSTYSYSADFTAAVSKNTVAKNEVFELVLTVNQRRAEDEIDFTALKQDFFMGRPAISQNSQYINGQTSSYTQWRIALAPIRLGHLTIPSFKLDDLSSQPIKIVVTANAAEPKPEDLVRFETTLDRDSVYPQQSVILTSRTIITADTRRLDNVQLSFPTAEQLNLEPIDQAKQYSAIIDGLQATIVEQQYRLTPSAAGEYQIQGAGLKAVFTFGDSLTRTTGVLSLDVVAKPVTLTVKPIPEQAPQPWLPANTLTLGQTWLPDGTENGASIAQGEAITREIHLAVSGIDPKLIADLDVQYPSSVRVYREKPQIVSLPNGQSQITFKHTLIPIEAGLISLPEIELPWWNANLAQSERASVSGKQFEIQAADSSLLPSMTPALTQPATLPTTSSTQWPWIAATVGFALLWLATLSLLIKERRQRHLSADAPRAVPDSDNLYMVLASGNSIAILQAVQTWRKSHEIDAELAQAIENELQKMQQAQYAKTPASWDHQALTQLLRQGRSRRTNQSDALPHL